MKHTVQSLLCAGLTLGSVLPMAVHAAESNETKEQSRFNIVDATPFDRDVLDELAKACRRHHMKLGFYYSQAQDWNNPGGAAARKLMAEGWPNPDGDKIDAFTAANQRHLDPAQMTRTMDEYIDQVAVPQVKELLSNCGAFPDVLWWDTPTGMNVERARKLHGVAQTRE